MMHIYGIKMRLVEKNGLLAVFSFCLGGLKVHGCKLVLKPDGRKLVVMPGGERGNVHPVNGEFRSQLTAAACTAYEKRRKIS